MNIHFTASLSGKKEFKHNYEKIVEVINSLGYTLITNNILEKSPEDVLKEKDEEAVRYYKKMVNWIKAADIVVAEVSYPSTGVGHEISLALHEGKPVIALYVQGKTPFLLESMQEERLQVLEYELSSLGSTLKNAIDDAKDQMDVRFNFFVSPKIVTYLDWIARQRKIPRAVYLRRLIEEDMKKNKEFLEE